MDRHRKKTLARLTTRPGVYLYRDSAENVIYIGKAKNLKARVRQYFQKDSTLRQKTQLLVANISSLQTIPTDSEFDAILLEATLIRKYQPKYNTIAKDDKSPLYVAITFEEDVPRLLFVRKHTIDTSKNRSNRQFIAGPFQSGRVARLLLRSIRRIIPYCLQKVRDGRPCFYTHLGLCFPCPSEFIKQSAQKATGLRQQYRKNLRRIALLLSGKARIVRRSLESEMTDHSAHLRFEKAGEIKRQLEALALLLTHSFDPEIYTDRASSQTQSALRIVRLVAAMNDYGMTISALTRIECIDISNISGMWATGSLVVFMGGAPDTYAYRRFRIKITATPNDVGMMREVILRRVQHPEWPLPDLLVVDGGKPQVQMAIDTLASASVAIPVIGLAKRFEEIIIIKPDGGFTTMRLRQSDPALHLLQHIRDEAHRFAKKYHKFLQYARCFVTI